VFVFNFLPLLNIKSMSDSTPIAEYKRPSADLVAMLADGTANVQYKLFALMFITFLGLSSVSFIDRVLVKFSDAVNVHTPTSWGTVLHNLRPRLKH
jgi:hypothetical protein